MAGADDIGAAQGWRSADLEALARRLLELLGRLSGLDSTYLTAVDWTEGLQEVLYARNAGTLDIPEGLQVAWSDTLCRRALDGGPARTSDVAATYPDSAAARELGIATYVTVPVRGPDGDVFGTVCGADRRGVEVPDDVLAVMEVLADMVGLQLAAEAARRELAAANAVLSELAYVDGLTGVGNRRALDRLVERDAAAASDAPASVIVVDVDHFKQINDAHGHAAGDAVLTEVTRRLVAQCRADDLVVRTGGDEFAVVLHDAPEPLARDIAGRLQQDVSSRPVDVDGVPVDVTVSVGVASGVRDVPGLLRRADGALYVAKERGRDGVASAE